MEEEVWVEKASAFYRLTEILYLLREDPRFAGLRSKYQQWLLDFPEQENFDYTARKISFLTASGGEITRELDKLLQGRNFDGGWGFKPGYESSPWDTVLVLRALLDAGYEDLSVYQGIIAFLNAWRNYDGSFSPKKNDEGHLYLTALLVKELERLNNFLDCSHLLVPARQWLAAQGDYTGVYGGSILETALCFSVILDLLTPTQLDATVNLLESSMLPNGSWEDDPLTTAAVLAALGGLAPDLMVTMDEILFSPSEPYLRDQVKISVTVRNSGFAPAENVEVRLYHEEDGGAVLVGSVSLPVIPVGQGDVASFTWQPNEAGVHQFTVVVDPEGLLPEISKENNRAAKMIKVIPRLDLTVTAEDIRITPEDPGPADTLRIKVVVHNEGYLPAEEFSVLITNGLPGTGGKILGQINVPGLAGQASIEVTAETNLPEGEYRIYVTVDPDNLVEEDWDDNNQAFYELVVKRRFDLAISSNNIFLSNSEPVESEKIIIYATVINKREEPVENVPVAFYLGDPKEGNFLGKVVLEEVAGNMSALAQITWDTTGITGRNYIYVWIDPEETITEVDKTNNLTLQVVYITPRPDLAVQVTAGAMVEGVPGNINIRLANQGKGAAGEFLVRTYWGDPAGGVLLTDDILIPGLASGATYNINVVLDTAYRGGTHMVYAEVDPENRINETNETNNLAGVEFQINPPPELVVLEEEISLTPSPVHEGDRVLLTAVIRNQSVTRVQNVPVRIYWLIDEEEWEPLFEGVVTVQGEQTVTVETEWDSDYRVGTNSFMVHIDPENTIYERDKENNMARVALTVLPAHLPDLAVNDREIGTVPPGIPRNGSGLLAATIHNLRAVPAENVTVRFYEGSPFEDGDLIGETVVSIPGRGEARAEITWEPAGTESYRGIYVWVDPEGEVEEYDTGNNLGFTVVSLAAPMDYRPQNLRAQVDYNRVDLEWDEVTVADVTGYMVYRDGLPIASAAKPERGTATASSFSSSSYPPEKALDGQTNTYWISRSGLPAWWEEKFAHPQYLTALEIDWYYTAADYEIQVWTGERYLTLFKVEGNNNSTVRHELPGSGLYLEGYRIYIIRTTSSYAGIREVSLSGREVHTAPTFTDEELLPGTYQYTVTALNHRGEESIPSLPVTAGVLLPAGPPEFTAGVRGCTVELQWKTAPIADVTGYYLRRNGQLVSETETAAGTASASGYYSTSYTPDRAFDGNSSTYWRVLSTSSGDIWWQVNFSESRYLSELLVNWRSIPCDYEILLWLNGRWQKVAEVKNNLDYLQKVTLPGDYKTDRLRLSFGERRSSSYIEIYEIEPKAYKRLAETAFVDAPLVAGEYEYTLTVENSVYAESAPLSRTVTVNPPQQPENLRAEVENSTVVLSWDHQQEPGFMGYLIYRNDSLVKSGEMVDITGEGRVSASSMYSTSTGTERAVDRNTGTYWMSAAGYPQWFSMEFDRPQVISAVEIRWERSSYAGQDYCLQYKKDGDWQTIKEITGNSSATTFHEFPYPVYTDGVRLYCTKNNGYSYIRITEFYVYKEFLPQEKTFADPEVAQGEYIYRVAAVDEAANRSLLSDPAAVKIGTLPAPKNLRATVEETEVLLEWEIDESDLVGAFNIYRNDRLVGTAGNVTSEYSATASHGDATAGNIFDGDTSTYWYPGYRQYPSEIILTSSRPLTVTRLRLEWRSTSYAAKDYNILALVDGSWTLLQEVRNNTAAVNEFFFEKTARERATNQLKLEILSGPNYIYLTEVEIYALEPALDLTYQDKILRDGNYTYYVKTVSIAGELSGPSNLVEVSITDRRPPAAPGGFVAVEQSGRLQLQWAQNREEDLAGYNLYLEDEETPLNTSLIAATTTSYNYTFTNGVQKYQFRLEAVDINGNRSEPAEVVFAFARPEPPSNLTAVNDKLDVTLSWDAPAEINLYGYKVFRNGELLNNLNKRNPAAINPSSVYFQNANYAGTNVNDNNNNTFWRPALGDEAPFIELEYSILQFLSAVKITWHSPAAVPEEYMVQAEVDGVWVDLFAGGPEVEKVYALPETVVTKKIRLIITRATALVALARFEAFGAGLLTSRNYVDRNLTPGVYSYHVTTVSRAGLESRPSTQAVVEITTNDLSILPGDLYYTPYLPSVFDNITITVQVINLGTETMERVPVGLFAGDPAETGIRIANLTTEKIEPGEKVLLQYIWAPEGFAGKQEIFAVVDPDNTINEYDKTNNVQSIALEITEYPVLATTIAAIDPGDFPLVRLAVQVNDPTGAGVAGLRKENFVLKENGVLQEITKLTSIVDEETGIPKIDLVFVIDTSGSMGPTWNTLPEVLAEITDELTRRGIDLQYKVYSMAGFWSGAEGIPTNEILRNGIFRGNTINITVECWGPATAWVAVNYPWREGAFRVIVPISDEDAYRGMSQTAEDWESVYEATALCQEYNIETYPIYDDAYYGAPALEPIVEEMSYMAENTGGEVFHYENARQIAAALTRVLSQKRVDYYLEYTTTNPSRDGTRREVTVEATYRYAEGSAEGEYRAPQDTYCNLAAVSLAGDKDAVNAGQDLALTGTVANIGGVPAEEIPVGFYLGDPAEGGLLLEMQTIALLAPDETVRLESTWYALPGEHRLYLVVDPGDTIVETDKTNNVAVLTVPVAGNRLPDLLVLPEEICFDSPGPACGQKVEVTARVRNLGDPAGEFSVAFYRGDPESGGQLMALHKVAGLNYLEYTDLTAGWVTSHEPAAEKIYVIADPRNEIRELYEENNKAWKEISVSERPVMGFVATDKEAYLPQEEVQLYLRVENKWPFAWSGLAKVVIRDEEGRETAEVGSHSITEIPSGTEMAPGIWEGYQVWNTGSLPPGRYLAMLELYQLDDCCGVFAAEFQILPHRDLTGELFTDKTLYSPGDEAVITVNYRNMSSNTPLEDIVLEVSVRNGRNEEVWVESLPIKYLPVEMRETAVFYWPVENSAAGEYQVTAIVSRVPAGNGEESLWSETKTVTVEESVVLEGSLAVEPRLVRAGQEVELAYILLNRSNKAIDMLPLKFLFVDPENEEILKVVETLVTTGSETTFTGSVMDSISLPDGYYLVIMQAEVEGEVIPLANAGLTVDSTPPVTVADYPGGWINTGTQVALEASDELSGVKESYYRVNGGAWEVGTTIPITGEGIHTVEFYSLDQAGNEEEKQEIYVKIDWTPPETNILLAGDEGPDGSFRGDVTVTLTAVDNSGGAGVAVTYYRLGITGEYQAYTEPFVLTQEGTMEIHFYSVDQAGNEEAPQRVTVKIQKGWYLPYSLLCKELTIHGHLTVDRVFVNGPVKIYGHCDLEYLGTTEKNILKTGPSTIKLLETGLPPQEIREPDWEGLRKVTVLQKKNQISQDSTLNNLRFANDLQISGTTRIKGLLVVEGDLSIHGNVTLENAGIFCTGTITFNGNVSGSGLIYAGKGLMIHGNPQIKGMIIVNGPVTGSGNVGNAGVAVEEYLKWFK